MLVLLRASAIILAAFHPYTQLFLKLMRTDWLLLLQANTRFNDDTFAQLQKPLACGLSTVGVHWNIKIFIFEMANLK